MSLHIIKCKTILKISEIETINLTRYLNSRRRVGTGRGRGEHGALGLRRLRVEVEGPEPVNWPPAGVQPEPQGSVHSHCKGQAWRPRLL